MNTQNQETIFHIQRKLYKTLKKKAQNLFEYNDNISRKYENDLFRYSNKKFKISSFEELIESAISANIVYLSDFHTFDQNIKNFERFLYALIQHTGTLIIVLELVHAKNQKYIQAFLNERITEFEFLESINYSESWRFPWVHYKKIFLLAKKYKFKIIAANSQGSLIERDKFAAKTIIKYIQKADSKVFVLFGEHHLVPDKLPRIVKDEYLKKSKEKVKHTIIQQNLDSVFFKLADRGFSSEVVSFKDGEYSIQSSPAWIKYESLIYWYESILDDPEFELHDLIFSKNFKTIDGNAHSNFLMFVNELVPYFSLDQINKQEIENFNLYDYNNLSVVIEKLSLIKSKKLFNHYVYLLTHANSFNLPDQNIFYCSNYSMNSLTFLAGNHLFSLLAKKINYNWTENLISKNHFNKFNAYFNQMMISYYSMKVFNPYRKCELYLDIKKKSESKKINPIQKEYFMLALDIIDTNKSFNSILKGKNLTDIYFIAKIFSNFLVEILFRKNQKEGFTYFYNYLISSLKDDKNSEVNFFMLKDKILINTNYKKSKKNFF